MFRFFENQHTGSYPLTPRLTVDLAIKFDSRRQSFRFPRSVSDKNSSFRLLNGD